MLRRYLRVLLSFALVLLAASVFTVSASADDDHDDDGGATPQLVDRAFGAGTADFVGGSIQATFDFDVTGGADGGAATGPVLVTTTNAGGVIVSGTATCLKVAGNLAWFEVNNSNPLGPDVVVYVGDFGTPGAGVDHFNFDFLFAEADAVCTGTQTSEQSVRTGDIWVQDNVPASSGGDDDEDEEDEDDDDEDD